jgi:hypothetical protein
LAVDRGAQARWRSGETDARLGRIALGDRKAVARQVGAINVLAKPESKAGIKTAAAADVDGAREMAYG